MKLLSKFQPVIIFLLLITCLSVLYNSQKVYSENLKSYQDDLTHYKLTISEYISEEQWKDKLINSSVILGKGAISEDLFYSLLSDELINVIVFANNTGCQPCFMDVLRKLHDVKKINIVVVGDQLSTDHSNFLYSLKLLKSTIHDNERILFNKFGVDGENSAVVIMSKNNIKANIVDCFIPKVTNQARMDFFVYKLEGMVN